MRTRLSSCQRKVRYTTREAAADAVTAIGLVLHPYACDRCRRWHLTSRTKGRRQPKPDQPSPDQPSPSRSA